MESIFTNNLSVTNAQNFKKFLTGAYGNLFLTFGRAHAWANNEVPTPVDTANTFYDYWDNIIGLKKVSYTDISLVIPRVDWANGEIYTEYGQDVEMYLKANTANVAYDNPFYVRNNKDQIFKCLSNNEGVASTIMPEIDSHGQLPENAYIEGSDGYKWKYMYTIPSGLKERFFTKEYMPVVEEPVVFTNAVDGRLDIIKLLNPGAGYNANSNSNNYNILTVSGDGSGANISVKVATTAANGANVIGFNLFDGGYGYTKASAILTDPNKISNTANAEISFVIGPPGGHGSNVARELGARNIMISVGIEGNEAGLFPITEDSSTFRQIGILKNPLLSSGTVASDLRYRATTKYYLSQPTGSFTHGEPVYIGPSLEEATFSAIVEYYTSENQSLLYLNNISGTATPPATISSNTQSATIIKIEEPTIKRYSGELLYIDNSDVVNRTLTETQQLKLTLRF